MDSDDTHTCGGVFEGSYSHVSARFLGQRYAEKIRDSHINFFLVIANKSPNTTRKASIRLEVFD
jgi:hypothetical protein